MRMLSGCCVLPSIGISSIPGKTVLNINGDSQALRQVALKQSRLMRHRGPDWSGIYACEGAVLAHERLSIVDVNTGAQPLFSPDGKQSLAVNGEIYNHKALRQTLTQPFCHRRSDRCPHTRRVRCARGAFSRGVAA